MAEVVRPGGIGEQLALVAGLRWRLFRNALRTTSGQLDLAAQILVGALLGAIVVGLGLAIGAGAYAFAAQDRTGLLALLLWATFLAWHFLPILMATSTASFDFRSLLRFPLRFSVFFLLSLAYGLSDPAVVAALFWLICAGLGIVLARPELLPWTVVILAVFATMNLLLSRMIFSWLERLLARRRTREALAAILVLLILGFQLSTAVGARWQTRVRPYVRAALPVLQQLPPSLAGKALAGAVKGDALQALRFTGFVAAYGFAFGLLLRRRLRAQYLGEDLGESQAPAVVLRASGSPTASLSSASLAPSYLPGAVAAVFEKELRYVLRNSALLLLLAIPLILIVFFSLTFGSRRPGGSAPDIFTRTPELAFPGAVAYMLLILGQMAHNSFAYDGRGVQLLFVAPVRFRDVLIGKNLLLGLLVLLEACLVWLLISVLASPPDVLVVVATFSYVLFFLLTHFLVGNWLSLRFPRRFEFGQHRRRASGVTLLVSFGLQFVLAGMAAGVVLLARLWGWMWLVPVVFLALSAAALEVYKVSLDAFDRLAARQREVLTAQLCRQ
ncbi:MAG: hypothetical protein HY237_09165 [Acidobacteria bacterium]|nr:hypothetical protein [Acidobacteriota bacterium]